MSWSPVRKNSFFFTSCWSFFRGWWQISFCWTHVANCSKWSSFGAGGSSVHFGYHQQHGFGRHSGERSSFLSVILIKYDLEILKSECYIQNYLQRLINLAILKIPFRHQVPDESSFSRSWIGNQDKGKKGTELFSSYPWSRKVLPFLSRLIKNVLYFSFRCLRSQRRRRADIEAFDANHECFKAGRSKLWSCLHEIIMVVQRVKLCCQNIFLFSARWSRRHFSFFSDETEAKQYYFSFLASPAWVNVGWGLSRFSYIEEQV